MRPLPQGCRCRAATKATELPPQSRHRKAATAELSPLQDSWALAHIKYIRTIRIKFWKNNRDLETSRKN